METLLRFSHPDLGDLILNVTSLKYHETLMELSMRAYQCCVFENSCRCTICGQRHLSDMSQALPQLSQGRSTGLCFHLQLALIFKDLLS